MSRSIDGDDDKISHGNGTSAVDNIWDSGGSHFAWINAVSAGDTTNIGQVNRKVDTTGWNIFTRDPSGSTCQYRAGIVWTGTNRDIRTTNRDINFNTWHSCALTYDSDLTTNQPLIFIDGVSKDITTNDPTGTRGDDTAQNLFTGTNANGDQVFDGLLANIAFWDTELVANDFVILNRGVNPFVVKNDNLLFFEPLWGNEDPEHDYVGQANTGAITTGTVKGVNPPVELLENYL